jgi:chromosome segregation ATPase
MSRPQKCTDSDIADAIQSMVAEGVDLNPMRVRTRLGGGNIARIKAVLARQSGQLATAALIATLPNDLAIEFQRLSGDMSQHFLGLARKCWAAASNEAAAGLRDENAQLRQRLEALGADLTASTNLAVELEGERDGKERHLEACLKGKEELARQCGDLKAALRNAESDLRATQKLIDNYDHNQRQDRDEIRQLQKHIEELVAELATARARAAKANSSPAAGTRKRPSV